jgi:hypothetical protein
MTEEREQKENKVTKRMHPENFQKGFSFPSRDSRLTSQDHMDEKEYHHERSEDLKWMTNKFGSKAWGNEVPSPPQQFPC